MNKLGLNYMDLYLLHQPYGDVAYDKKEDITTEAWAPFAEGKHEIFTNETIAKIGEKYGKSNGQGILWWLLQRGIVVIPKSVHKARIAENFFELSNDDMKVMANLDKNESQFFDHRDPAAIENIFGSSLKALRT